MYFVYIIESIINHRWYIGSSDNPDRRLEEHNKGSTRSTKPFTPYKLIYSETYQTRAAAVKRELLIKKSGRIRNVLKKNIYGPIV